MEINQESYELLQKQLLEEKLGVPFFDSLIACAKLRIKNLTDVCAAAYALTLLMGVKNRHSWISEDSFTKTYCEICGTRLKRMRDAAKEFDEFFSTHENRGMVNDYVLGDLLTALGVLENTYHPTTESQLLNRDDLLRLNEVAVFGDISFGDVANLLN